MFDLFKARSNLLPHAFVRALYIHMGKMLKTHILDVSSIIQLNRNLMMTIWALMRHKIAKWAGRISKMATTAVILKINFRHLFSNLRSPWAETCFLATGWLLDRNKLKLCWSKIQDGLNGSLHWTKWPPELKNRKSSNDISCLANGLISKDLHRSIPPMALNQNYKNGSAWLNKMAAKATNRKKSTTKKQTKKKNNNNNKKNI